MVTNAASAWTARWIRADGVGIFAAALSAVSATHGAWTWCFVLFLAPDLSMIGYLLGARAGAVAYNAAHVYAVPLGVLALGLGRHSSFATTAALTWIAHIAFDHALGYGLKLPTSFEETALGPIGRSRGRTPVASREQPIHRADDQSIAVA